MENTPGLEKKLQQREAEITVITSVQEALLARMEMQGIYDLVGEQIRELFDSQVTVVSTFNYNNHTEQFHYCVEDGERHYLDERPIDKLRQRLIDTTELICINENADEVWKELTGEEPTVVPGTKLTKSALYVPMVAGTTVFGYISLQNVDREHAFSESDIRLLSTLAGSISVALENARLFNETEQRNAELAVINSVQEGLVAEMGLQGIYDLVGEKIRTLFDAQVVVIATFDHENGTEKFQYVYENGKRFFPSPRPFDKIRQRLIRTQKMIWINDNAAEAFTTITGEPPKAAPGTSFPKSMVYVPLIISDSVRGYVSLQNLDREQAFSESDIRLLSTLANSMSVALENARLFNETEQRNAELAVINSVQQGLVAEMDMQGIYDLVGERIQNVFDAQVAAIVTFDHENKMEQFAYLFEDGDRLYPSSRPYDKVREKIILERKTLFFNENAAGIMSEINGKPHKPVPGTRVARSAIYVPMAVGESVRGYVTLQNLDKEHAFSDSDVRLLNMLVNSMSVALENARLFNETTRLLAETEQRNAELAVINSVQEGLVREMDMEAIYSLVGNRICEVLKTQTMLIRTFDHSSGLEHWEYAIENGERLYSDPKPFIWANKQLIETTEPLLINADYTETAKKYGGSGVSKGLPPKSAVFVPMIVSDKVMGSVSLQNVEKEYAFTESDVRLLTTLTNSMSVALENARLFNETTRLLAETEQRAAELHTVNHISRAMVSQLEFDALIRLVGDQMKETFKADIVYIALYDKHQDTIYFPYEYGDKNEPRKFGDGFTERIITSNTPLLINKDVAEIRAQIKTQKIGRIPSSFLGVPIQTGDVPNGVISVQSTEVENRFDENDMRLLTTIAANVSVAMQNAEAYQKLRGALTDLKAAQEQLVQQEKLASLGQLTAGIAHEIKNPLNFVNNFSELSMEMLQEVRDEMKTLIYGKGSGGSGSGTGAVSGSGSDSGSDPASKSASTSGSDSRTGSGDYKSGADTDSDTNQTGPGKVNLESHGVINGILDDIQSNLRKIHEHGTRADGIVKSMLLHSRGGSGKVAPTDLNELIREYVNLAFHGMRAGKNPINVGINLELDENVRDVPLIAEDFSRVVLNLCNNAFDAMRDKEQALRSAQPPVPYNPSLTVRTHIKQRRLILEVEDNGPGIPDEFRDKILQPFFTTKKGKDGTGLGLSITNDIVKAHGGEISINGKHGEGTTFLITLKPEQPVT